MSTVALFDFDEISGIPPRDAVAGLLDLTPDATSTPALAAPSIVAGWAGLAREFGANTGLRALEKTPGALALRRDLTLEAIVSFSTAVGSNGSRCIVARGLRGSSSERRLFALYLVTSGAPGAPLLSLQAGWDEGAFAATVPAVTFQTPAGQWILLGAARRWISPSEVQVDYFVNGQLIGTVTSPNGGIVDGANGTTTIGCEGAGAGSYTNFFVDAIDSLRVTDRARTAEEMRAIYRRLFLHPSFGYDLIRSFLPPGEAYSTDPESTVQRELMVEGDALGYLWSKIGELEDDFLPDRATLSLERWEGVCGLIPGPSDTIDVRRQRVLGFLRTIAGYDRNNIGNAVAGLLELDPSQIVILEQHYDATVPTQVYRWFLWRDPALPGTPDIHGAQLVVDKMKPAHTQGIVCQSRIFLCDDPYSLTDRDPLGA